MCAQIVRADLVVHATVCSSAQCAPSVAASAITTKILPNRTNTVEHSDTALIKVKVRAVSRQFLRNVLVQDFLHSQDDDDRRATMRTRPRWVADLSAAFVALSRRAEGFCLVGRDSVEPELDLGSRDFRPTTEELLASDFFATRRSVRRKCGSVNFLKCGMRNAEYGKRQAAFKSITVSGRDRTAARMNRHLIG